MALSRSAQRNDTTVQAVASRMPVCGWGDSQMALGSSDWPATFTTLYAGNRGFFNGGVGGEGSAAIKARFDADRSRRHWPHIIWAGRNDVGAGFDRIATRTTIMAMVAALPHHNYRVLEILPSEDVAGHASEHTGTATRLILDALNAELAGLLGRHFVWLLSLLQAGGTGTGQDATDVANGIIPTSLRQAGSGIHQSLISVGGSASGNGIVRDAIGASIAGGW